MAEGEVRRLILNIPPRFMKSLLSMVFLPCWTWIHWPASRWITTSYAQDLAIRDAVKSRDVIESDWYHRNWGDRFQLKGDQNVKSRYANNWSGFRYSGAVRSAITGEGGDFLGVDDPINVRDAPNKQARERVNEWWTKVMATRLNNPKRGRKYIVMQRTHEDDLSGHMLAESAGEYVHFFIPMRFEEGRICSIFLPPQVDESGNEIPGYSYRDPRTTDGELAAPQRFGEREVAELEKSLSYQAAGQLQQRPTAAEGDIFRSSFVSYWTRQDQDRTSDSDIPDLTDAEFAQWMERKQQLTKSIEGTRRENLDWILKLVNFDGVVRRMFAAEITWLQIVDTALKEKQSADFTASAIVGISDASDLIVQELIMERLRVPKQFGFIMLQRDRFGYIDDTYVEDKQSGTGLIQQAADAGRPFRTLRADGDKVRRAQPLATFFQNGKVYFPSGNPAWLGPVLDQLLTFPNGLHDDAVDVLAYAAQIALEMKTSQPQIRAFEIDRKTGDEVIRNLSY